METPLLHPAPVLDAELGDVAVAAVEAVASGALVPGAETGGGGG